MGSVKQTRPGGWEGSSQTGKPFHYSLSTNSVRQKYKKRGKETRYNPTIRTITSFIVITPHVPPTAWNKLFIVLISTPQKLALPFRCLKKTGCKRCSNLHLY